MTRRLLMAWPAVLLARAEESWESRRFPDWDRDVADRLLTASPWARELKIPFRQPFQTAGRAGSVATSIDLTVRWGSALPVRQANAIALGLESRAGKKMLATEPREYVLELAGFPAPVVRDSKAFEKELAATAVLTGKGRRALTAVSAAVPEFGNFLMAEVRFARDAAIVLEDGEIEFAAAVLGGALKIRARFSLKAMVYGGRLEL